MRILTVSDKVEAELCDRPDSGRFAGIDLILGAGDLPPEYLASLHRRLRAPLFYVRGNHDIRHDSAPPRGCVDIHERLVRFGGLNILGLEGSHWYNGGPHQYHEAEMLWRIWRLKPRIWWRGGIDIVLTHAPPRHIQDAEDLCHRGFDCFRRLIEHHRPRYFVHGHIHADFADSSERITVYRQTRVLNTFGHFFLEIDRDGNSA
jgi:Icc-related predicted phosphoesterase